MKKTFYTEAAYFSGILILALGTALMECAAFGMSMVVAPAYILHLKLSETFSFFTFGMAEYMLQAVLILALALIRRRLKWSYLFSFCTAVFYGLVLDGAIFAVSLLPFSSLLFRLACFALGMVVCSLGVALLFNTYISPEAYELFVKELAPQSGMPLGRFKTLYDCASCLIAILLSFAFFGFGHFEGVKWGTVVCALLNGYLISRLSSWLHAHFDFEDALPLRRYFQ